MPEDEARAASGQPGGRLSGPFGCRCRTAGAWAKVRPPAAARKRFPSRHIAGTFNGQRLHNHLTSSIGFSATRARKGERCANDYGATYAVC